MPLGLQGDLAPLPVGGRRGPCDPLQPWATGNRGGCSALQNTNRPVARAEIHQDREEHLPLEQRGAVRSSPGPPVCEFPVGAHLILPVPLFFFATLPSQA